MPLNDYETFIQLTKPEYERRQRQELSALRVPVPQKVDLKEVPQLVIDRCAEEVANSDDDIVQSLRVMRNMMARTESTFNLTLRMIEMGKGENVDVNMLRSFTRALQVQYSQLTHGIVYFEDLIQDRIKDGCWGKDGDASSEDV